jgi:hypothetical protein
MINLAQLRDQIINGNLLGSDVFKELDLDKALDGRDEVSFDQTWINAFKSLEKLQIKTADIQTIDSIREAAFKVTYNHCEDSDLAGYISDDFELIAKAFLFNLDNSFINAIWLCYKKHIIPGNKIDLIDGKITEV